MAIAHVQTPAGGVLGTAVTSVALAFGSNVTAGDTIIGGWRYGAAGGRTVTLSDTLANTYTSNASGNAIDATDGSCAGIGFTSATIAGGACTVTFAISGAGANLKLNTTEVSAAGVLTVDKTSTASGSSQAPAAGSVTPTSNGQLFFAIANYAGGITYTAGTDFTMATVNPTPATTQRIATEYYVQPTAAAHNGDFTTTSSATPTWSAALVTLQEGGGGAPPSPGPQIIGQAAPIQRASQW